MNTKTLTRILSAVACFSLLSCTPQHESADQGPAEPVDHVNPYMGNISHILVPTFPTIHLPHSMLRVIPHRREYSDVTVRGLPVVLTSHRGTSAFSISPYQGDVEGMREVIDYTWDNEKITPYSYEVYLDEYQVQARLAVSERSAIYALEFRKEGPASLIFNSSRGALTWDGETLSGYQELGNGTRVYLSLVPDKTPSSVAVLEEGELADRVSAKGRNACLVLRYDSPDGPVGLSYGISFIDEAQAKANMQSEIGGQTLEEISKAGRATWNEALGRIRAEGNSPDEQAVFYTSLYRTLERPVCISEDGRYYSPFDSKVHNDNGRPFYIDDWIWDSYRAHHPLRTITDTRREEDILHSFILMAEQSEHFWLPTFPRITGDSRSMNANHGVATFLDAYRKGLDHFDLEKAYRAGKLAITEKTLAPWSGEPAGELDRFYHEHGYIPALYPGEEETIPEVHHFENRQAVAVTLGTAYDEWCLGQTALELGKDKEAEKFMQDALNYRKLYNSETGFFHPKDREGNFIEPFDYKFSGGMGARAYYDENNGWTYRWDVQHNIPDLVEMMGGKQQFVRNLDGLFREPMGRGKYEFYAQLPDQTGNVGQFSMANEPSLHIPYLYNYAGQPWKTQKVIHKLVGEWFRNDLMGVPGDEDGGGMSAFVVFSMMGFYPVTPGIPAYSIGSPFFEKVTIHLESGKSFTVQATNFSQDNKYIQSASLNGKPLDTPVITHEAIMNGGELELEMGPYANRNWGTGF